MTVVELRPHPVDINVWAGAPVTLEFTATLDNVAVDLSGATIVAQILTATGVEATTFGQTVSGAGENVLTLALTGVKTTALLSSLAGSPGRVSVTVDGFPWLGGSISIYPPGSAKAQPSFERTFAVTTGDGLAIAVEVIGGAGGGGAVDSVNGATGVVVLDADDIDDTATTNKFATAAQLSAVDGLATTYQPLDADLTTLAAGNIPTNLNASLASQYVALPAVEGAVGQAVKIASLAPLVTEWGDASGGGGASRVTFSNAAYTIVATDSVFVAQTGTMSAARIVTLPAASSFTAGAFITIVDESGTVTPTNEITVARAGADTINGAATSAAVTQAYGSLTFISDGSAKWTTPNSVSQHNGSGADSFAIGRDALASGSQSTAVGWITQATGTSTIAIGADARATANLNMAIGYSARAISGTTCTAIGYSAAAAGGTGSTAIGYAASSPVASGTAIGGSASAGGSGSVAIGYQAVIAAGQTSAVAIGREATITAGSGENIAIGGSSTANDWRATAVGFGARATVVSSTAIGRRALASASHAIAIGRGAWSNAAGMIAIGFNGGNVPTDVYFESGHTHKYVDEDAATVTRVPSSTPIVIHGFDAYDATGSPTNNVAGGDLQLAAGRGTGTAVGGAVKLQVAPAGGSSNNTKNTLVTVVEAGCSSTASTLGFFGAAPTTKPTGVAVDAAGIHAALVSLGLIAA
jgi:hypothetical protein